MLICISIRLLYIITIDEIRADSPENVLATSFIVETAQK